MNYSIDRTLASPCGHRLVERLPPELAHAQLASGRLTQRS